MHLLIYLLKYWLTGGHNGARTARRRATNVVRGRLAATPEPVRKKPASSAVGAATCGLDLLEVCAYRGSVPILIWLVWGCVYLLLLYQLRLYRANGLYVGFRQSELHIAKTEKMQKKGLNLKPVDRLLGAVTFV